MHPSHPPYPPQPAQTPSGCALPAAQAVDIEGAAPRAGADPLVAWCAVWGAAITPTDGTNASVRPRVLVLCSDDASLRVLCHV